ncbi:MAG: dimethylsulfonioproprionate lyase family protein [Rhodospirillaceae bacterium]|nr:dimethylsulfonioproprionate lyase family protein [Rhodospirillaceae bacterium]
MTAPKPAVVDQADLAWEGGEDANLATGTGIRWKLLITGERTGSTGLATGIAEVAPGSELRRHHHEPAETYYIMSGQGEIEIEGRIHAVKPGSAVYIPPDAKHALRCTGADPLVFVFAFPRDRFDKIVYHFDH